MTFLYLLAGILIGAVGAWLASQIKIARLETLLAERAQLPDQFEVLAGRTLEETSKRFAEQNQTNLNQLLEPLKNRIQEFQGKVEDVYVKETRDRGALAEQVRQLSLISTESNNLMRALRGSNKTQGIWGEKILETVLESSGLRKGEEYVVQQCHGAQRPDVIIRLPEGRHLIVDAKVTLTAYVEHDGAESDEDRGAAIKRHLKSVREHIEGLSGRNYQNIHESNSPDFVLMFMPVEPAFMLAIAHDPDLLMDAWKKNIMLVSPSTLLFAVRTVAHLWRQEQQSRNAHDIALRGAELYDKFVGFVTNLEAVGDRLEQATKSYDAAYGQLTGGRGNLVRQAQMLKDLGVKPGKDLRPELIEIAVLSETPNRDKILT